MSYTPSPGGAVILAFGPSWSAQAGSAVILDPSSSTEVPEPSPYGQTWPIYAAQALHFPAMGQIWPAHD